MAAISALATILGAGAIATPLLPAVAAVKGPGVVKKGVEEGVKWVDETTGAKAARDAQTASADALVKQGEDQITKMEDRQLKETLDAQAIAKRVSDRKRQVAGAAGAQGRSGTILTGPLGLTGSTTSGRKTLLGS